MKISWLLLAEGLGQDARGALTAVGLNQNVFAVADYPAQTKRAVVLHVEDGGEPSSGRLRVAFSVAAVGGPVLLAQTAEIELGGRKLPDLPGQFDVPAEFVFGMDGPGEYIIRAEVLFPDGSKDEASVSVFAVRPDDLT